MQLIDSLHVLFTILDLIGDVFHEFKIKEKINMETRKQNVF